VLFALRYGAAKSQNPQRNHERIDVFLTAVTEVVDFDDADADEAGEIRAFLEKIGAPIGPYDLLIAAQARRREAILVTANRREFERVPGLMVTDWRT
jgi:tRNA(fMet)-specific endonuclease VapC